MHDPAWAHRTLITRKLKGLEELICTSGNALSFFQLTVCALAFTVVSPRMGAHGWPFANVDPFPAAGVDPVNHAEHVKDLYLKADPNYGGRWVIDIELPSLHVSLIAGWMTDLVRMLGSQFLCYGTRNFKR